ncbi:MAG TPA: PAS domain S-box protein, partial [Chromatiales bacterium]|nr:PAS domain S-box protein [Chromatiales bacterium]
MEPRKLHALFAALGGLILFLLLLFLLEIPQRISIGNQAQLAIQQLDRMRPPMIRVESLATGPATVQRLQAMQEAAGELEQRIRRYLEIARYNPELERRVRKFQQVSRAWLDDERAMLARRLQDTNSPELLEQHHRAVSGFLDALRVLAEGEAPIHADIDEGRRASYQLQALSVLFLLYLLGLFIFYQWHARRALRRAYEDLRASRKALAEREAFLSRTLDSIGDAVIVCDAEGRITRINPVAEVLTGWPQSEVAGRPLAEVFSIVHARTRKAVENPVARVLREGKAVGLANHTVLIDRQGNEHHIADSAAPIRDAEGQVQGVILVFRDVTDEYRLQETLRRYSDELERSVAERTAELTHLNEELESFSYAVSHDLRAPLRSISGFARILQEDNREQLDEEGRDALDRITRAAGYMSELIDALLVLSRVGRRELRHQPVDISTMAEEILAGLAAASPERSVAWQVAENLQAEGDPELLRVLLDNLLGNAWKYTGRTEQARIE